MHGKNLPFDSEWSSVLFTQQRKAGKSTSSSVARRSSIVLEAKTIIHIVRSANSVPNNDKFGGNRRLEGCPKSFGKAIGHPLLEVV
jgi:hypothetical protein